MIDTLVLIDGHALAYRMYFALENTHMHTRDKIPTWAVYGFFNALFALLKDVQPDAIAVSFDKGKETFRNDLYDQYKANRAEMPDDMRTQMGIIYEGVKKFGIPIYEMPGYEADDVIGTVSRQAIESGKVKRVLILTGDQDAFQLVEDDKVFVLIPSRKPREGLVWYTPRKVQEKWGVTPEQVIDYKALRGDTSDNIPGVPGIGEKTAVKLLTEFPTLEDVYEKLESVKPEGLRKKLVEHRDMAFLSQKLATIHREVPVELNPADCHLTIPDIHGLLDYFQTYEFQSFLKQAPNLLAPFLHHDDHRESVANGIQSRLPRQAFQSSASPSSTSQTEGSTLVLTAPVVVEEDPTPIFQSLSALTQAQTYQVPHRLITTSDDLTQWVETLRSAGVFALDMETTGLDVFKAQAVGFAMAVSPGRFQRIQRPAKNILNVKEYPKTFPFLQVLDPHAPIETVYIPVGHIDPETGKLQSGQLPTEEVLGVLKPLLQDPSIMKLVHNAKYELNLFRRWGVSLDVFGGVTGSSSGTSESSIGSDFPVLDSPVFDSMIASYVCQPDQRHGLKALGFSVFQANMPSIETLIGTGKKQIPFSHVPLDAGASYAACDAEITLKLVSHFVSQMDEAQQVLFSEIEMPLCRVLAAMEYEGVALDTGHLKHLQTTIDSRLEVLEGEIYALAGMPFNINSPKQVGDILFERMGIQPLKKTAKKTAYSTDAKVLEQLADDHEIVRKLLEFRQLFKLKSTYIETLPTLIRPETGRVHTSFNQTITATGRLSSSEPNLQNIPVRTEIGRSIREAFVARPGSVLLSADYSQIELRLLAHFSEDPHLIEAFNQGQDIHAATASLVYGVPLDQVTKEMRYRAKAVNFGIIYGQTAHGLSQQLDIPRSEAQAFIDKYFSRYDRVRACIEGIQQEAHKTGIVRTIAGRVRDLSEGLQSRQRGVKEFAERAAFNTPLQGSASDLMKVAMIRLFRKLRREQLKTRIILQVHDELVLDVPTDEMDAATRWVQWAMELDQPLLVPLVVDIHTGNTWMET